MFDTVLIHLAAQEKSNFPPKFSHALYISIHSLVQPKNTSEIIKFGNSISSLSPDHSSLLLHSFEQKDIHSSSS